MKYQVLIERNFMAFLFSGYLDGIRECLEIIVELLEFPMVGPETCGLEYCGIAHVVTLKFEILREQNLTFNSIQKTFFFPGKSRIGNSRNPTVLNSQNTLNSKATEYSKNVLMFSYEKRESMLILRID